MRRTSLSPNEREQVYSQTENKMSSEAVIFIFIFIFFINVVPFLWVVKSS